MSADLNAIIHKYVQPGNPAFIRASIAIIAAPLIWNIVARTLRPIVKDKPINVRYNTCYLLAVWIFCFSSFRDVLFHAATAAIPSYPPFTSQSSLLQPVSILLGGIGQLFVLSSFWKLGITGTFLGDYCGILMDARVTGFPFSVLENPMYVGSTLTFLASSLYSGSLAGVVLTGLIWIVYSIALIFEGSYTTMIYAEREAEKSKRK